MNRDEIFNHPHNKIEESLRGPGQVQHYQFTSEELRVLRECNRDSFFQRCLPIGTILGAAAYYGVQTGHLKPSPRWGAMPKVFVASVVGYFLGKISYQSVCAEKIMKIPDSRLGAILRQRKAGPNQENLEPEFIEPSTVNIVSPSEVYSNPPNSTDVDLNRPPTVDIDDYHRPSLDLSPYYEQRPVPPAPVQDKRVNYDDLRQQNREEYLKQRSASYRGIPAPVDVPPVRRPTSAAPVGGDQAPISVSKKTNAYGDIME